MSIHTSVSSRSQQLILVGTVHTDGASVGTLVSILHSVDPGVIALETSTYSISFRPDPGARLKCAYRRFLRDRGIPAGRGGELSCRIAHLRIPFEYLAARAVRRSHGTDIVHLGRTRDAEAGLVPLLREQVDDEWLSMLCSTGQDHADRLRAAIREATAGSIDRIDTGIRDRVMARRIRCLLEDGTRVAAVMGWKHIPATIRGSTGHALGDRDPLVYIVAGAESSDDLTD